MSEHTSENVLVKKIVAATQDQVEAIRAQAQSEVADIKQATEDQVTELGEQAAKQLEKKKQQQELVALSKARQLANIAVQTAKRNAVDSAFAKAFAELAKMSSEEYKAFFSAHVQKNVPAKSEVVSVHAPANRIDESKQIVSDVLGSNAEITPTTESKAGLIITTTDGVYDITLERLISEKRPELEVEIVNQVTS